MATTPLLFDLKYLIKKTLSFPPSTESVYKNKKGLAIMIQWFIKRMVFLAILFLYSCSHGDDELCVSTSLFPTLTIIYEDPPKYVAFCDIVQFKDKFYTAFRKGEDHAPYHDYSKNGYIVILSSDDCENWHEEIELKDDKWDLRDPCFCVDPTGNTLHVYYGRYSYFTPKPDKNRCFCAS